MLFHVYFHCVSMGSREGALLELFSFFDPIVLFYMNIAVRQIPMVQVAPASLST